MPRDTSRGRAQVGVPERASSRGAEDGTAEEHLKAAADRGEYSGEGRRVRSDGSTFLVGVTITALWDESGTLLGFAKVTRDLTAWRAAEALLRTAAEAANTARGGCRSNRRQERVHGDHEPRNPDTDQRCCGLHRPPKRRDRRVTYRGPAR